MNSAEGQGRVPRGTPVHHGAKTWGTEFPEATATTVNKPVVMVAVLGLALAVFGVVRSFVAPAPQAAVAAPAPSVYTEQQRTMRDAVQKAREVRDAQREHTEMLRRRMESAGR